MRLTADHPDFGTTLVYLDGKLCKLYMAADDQEGWVDIPDLTAMAPLDLSEEAAAAPTVDQPNELEPWEEIPIKRLEGTVEFRKLKK